MQIVRCLADRRRSLALTTLVLIAVLAVAAGTASASPRMAAQSSPTTTCGYDDSGYSATYACGSNAYATAGTPFSGQVASFQITSTGQSAGVTLSSATIDWGDGTPTSGGTISGSPNGTVSGSHTYASPGLYSVTVDVSGCASGGYPCGTVQVNGTASVDAVGSTSPSSISVGVAPDSPADGNYTITAQALDGSGNVMAGYNDAAPTWSDTHSDLGSQTPAAFVDGVSTTTGVVLSTPATNEQVSVSSGGATGASAPFAVIGPLSKFVITPTGPETAGQAFTVTVRAEDAAGNTISSYAGSPTWSDTSAQLTGTPAGFTNGVSTNQVTLTNPAHIDRITVTDSAQSVSSKSSAFNVVGPLSKFVITPTGPETAGQAFTVTVRAEDAAGNTITSYAGSPTWSDTSAQLTGTPAGFTNGVSTNQVTLTNPVRRDTITVTDSGQSVSSKSSAFNVVGPLSKFVITPTGPETAGQAFTVTVRAEDAAGNTISSYAGSPTWSDTSAQLTGTPAGFTNGVSTNQVTLDNPASADQITVSDGAVSSTSSVFSVVTCNFDSSGFQATYQCGVNVHATAGTTFSGQVASFQITSNGQSAGVTLSSATIDWGDGTPTSAGTISGSPNGTISGSHTYASPGTYTVTVDTSGCESVGSQCGTVESTSTATVKPPRPKISVAVSPDGSGDGNYTITARALDGSGNVMTYYNDAAPTWSDTHSDLGSQTPAAFVDGVSTTTGVVLSTPATNEQVSVSSGGATGASAPFAVIGPLSKFVITPTGPETAGQAFTVTVRAEDAAGNTISSYAGSPTWSDTSAQLTGTPAGFTNGVSTNQVTLTNPAHIDRITVTDSAQSVSSKSSAFNVVGPLSKFVITPTGPETAGQAFTVTVRAEDAAGNTITSYAGSPTWSDTSAQLTGTPAGFTNGVSTNQVTLTNPVRRDTITVTDSAQSVTDQSAAFNVVGGPSGT